MERECRLCRGSLEGLRVDATFCTINHRSLYHKWKSKGLNDNDIHFRYSEIKSKSLTEHTIANPLKIKETLKDTKPIKNINKPQPVTKSPHLKTQQLVIKDYGISRTTLFRWHKKGLIKQYKVDGLVFYDVDGINNMITSNQTS